MSDLPDLAAAPVDAPLKGFTMTPLTIGDMAAFERWAEESALDAIDEKIKRYEGHGAISPEQKQKMLDDVYSSIGNGSISGRAMISIAGTTRLLWLSLKHKHPDITEAAAGELIEFGGLTMWQKKLDRLSGMDDDRPNEVTAPENLPVADGKASTAT